MKAQDEINELRQLNAETLKEKILESENELMNLRFRHSTTQLVKTAQLGRLRKTVARAKTVLGQQSRVTD